MSFMQLLSERAVQSLTFHCKDTVAHTGPRDGQKKAIALMSWNDLEIKNKGKFQYEVVKDDCANKSQDWASSIFKVDTDKPTRLPVVDIRIADFGGSDQAFKIDLGKFVLAENQIVDGERCQS